MQRVLKKTQIGSLIVFGQITVLHLQKIQLKRDITAGIVAYIQQMVFGLQVMLSGIRFFFLMAFFIVGCDVSLDNEPKRPALIMANSVWVGGLDGGHWISCSKYNDNGYYCRIYLPSGSLFLYGEYCFNENKNLNMGNLTYQDFDGLFITLVGDKKLLPNGVIHFPHEEGHGKQQRYKCGISIGKEREY